MTTRTTQTIIKVDKEKRDRIRESLNAQQLPQRYYISYVGCTMKGFGPYVIGFDHMDLADDLCDELKSRGDEAIHFSEYPFELEVFKGKGKSS